MKFVSWFLDVSCLLLTKAPHVAHRAWGIFCKSGWRGLKQVVAWRLSGHNDYGRWVREYDTLTPAIRAKLMERVELMTDGPLISVLMPSYNANPVWLREAVESVRDQIYPNWELCIADDASPSAEVRAMLKAYAESDPRIKVVFRSENGHISAASNSALAVASGAWIALMDHDDLLPPHALFWVADCIAKHPDVQLIYSDEDKVDEAGQRSDPYFKSDWNVDLFRSQNMFSHLGVLSMELVRTVGGFRKGLEGSQDWDLVLRCTERIEPRQIQHIPRVLYHWRVHADSTSKSMSAKPYAAVAGERALDEHFARTGVSAKAEYLGYGYRVRYALPDVLPTVSVIIPTRNAAASLRRCVESITGKTTYVPYDIVIVDNASDDASTRGYLEAVAKTPNVRVLRQVQVQPEATLRNLGVEAAQGELVALVDDSIEVIAPDWLSEMVCLALQSGVGAVGARLWHRRRLQNAGIILGLGYDGVAGFSHQGMPMGLEGYAGRAALIQSLSAVSGACLVIRKADYQRAGGFDAHHLKEAFADVDFCLRLGELGLRNVWTPYAELFQHVRLGRAKMDGLRGGDHYLQDVAFMHQRWGALLQHDRAYNPNLMLVPQNFSYAWPPRLSSV